MTPKTAIQFLDAIKAKHGLPSDYRLAKVLGVTRQAVSNYRRGTGFEDRVCVRVAELLELEPMQVIAARNLERAKRTDDKKLWEGVLRKVAGAALGLFLAGLLTPIAPDGFMAMKAAAAQIDNTGLHLIRTAKCT